MGNMKLIEMFGWLSVGFIPVTLFSLAAIKPEIKYIYDDEARLVGFCNGKYLIRTEEAASWPMLEDEFPASGCMFIEPIVWKD